MNQLLNVVIVLARCSRSRQPFGMRFEEKGRGSWVVDWAFALPEATARKEGYDRNTITGSFALDPKYPGCPGCGCKGWFLCGSCGKVACWNGEQRVVTCPWCSASGELSGTVSSLASGSDR